MCTGERSTDKIRRVKIPENCVDYVEAYFQLTISDEQWGIRELHQDFKKQTYNCQTSF